MAPQLWLLRHGEAVPHESKPDAERELTPRGERQAVAAGEGLAKLGLEFDACYTSPKVRARDTARLACEALNVEPVEEDVAGRTASTARTRSSCSCATAPTRACWSSATSRRSRRSCTTSPAARIDFKKGGVAAVRAERASGELLVLLRPRELESLALS